MKNETRVATMNIAPLGIGYLCLKEYSRFALMFFGGGPSDILGAGDDDDFERWNVRLGRMLRR